jgi:hypothetical protein
MCCFVGLISVLSTLWQNATFTSEHNIYCYTRDALSLVNNFVWSLVTAVIMAMVCVHGFSVFPFRPCSNKIDDIRRMVLLRAANFVFFARCRLTQGLPFWYEQSRRTICRRKAAQPSRGLIPQSRSNTCQCVIPQQNVTNQDHIYRRNPKGIKGVFK